MSIKTDYELLIMFHYKERKWFGAACFSMVFAHNFSGLIARSWSTEAQGNIPAFLFLWHRKERGDGHLHQRRRGFWAGRSPILPYRSSLSYSMTNPWISKRRSTIFLICAPSCCPGFGVHIKEGFPIIFNLTTST